MSEKIVRILINRNIVLAMKLFTTLKILLVHPKYKAYAKEGVYAILVVIGLRIDVCSGYLHVPSWYATHGTGNLMRR